MTVFAAASTSDAVERIAAEFQQQHAVDVQVSCASTSALAQQVVHGADADVFLSADRQWADFLEEKNHVVRRSELLGNRLAVIVPAGSKIEISQPKDLLDSQIRHLAMADPDTVPAGIYAQQALHKLGLWKDLRAKVVAGGNVRQALAYVETGAAEAGIVYTTDARISEKVDVRLRLDPELSAPIRYPALLLEHGRNNPAATAFYEYLQGPEAAAVFAQSGFEVRPQGGGARAQAVAPLAVSEWDALRLSFGVAACAALAGLPLAVAVGYLLARTPFAGKWLVEAVVNLPLVMPPVVTGYLLLVLLEPRGPIGGLLDEWFGIKLVFTWWAAVLAATVVSFPLMVRAIRVGFQGVDPRLELAARSLGASRLGAFFRVTLPLARQGVVAGWLLAFARSLGEFGATIMVASYVVQETSTIPLEIYHRSQGRGGFGQCWRLVVLSVVLACGALVVSELFERKQARRELA